MLNENLSFDDHLEYIVNKIAKKIGILARSTKLVNKNCRIKVYNSIILPYFVYCSSILLLLNTTQMDKLQKLRIILNMKYNINIRSMLKELKFKWLSVNKLLLLTN